MQSVDQPSTPGAVTMSWNVSCRRSLGLVLCALTLAGALPDVRGIGVSGVVFLDANANGTRDADEGGVAEVPVTDGLHFAVTGTDGHYRLDAAVDAELQPGLGPVVTVVFPNRTWPTTAWFQRVDADTDLERLDFGLRADAQSLPFVFVHGTDPHVPRGGRPLFEQFRAEMGALAGSARFCVLTGDLVNLADSYELPAARADYELFHELTRGFPVPLFCTSGNHEPAGVRAATKQDPTHPDYGYGLYRRIVGPLRWSFNYAGYHLVGIDFNTARDGTWSWGVPPSAATWLERDLALLPDNTPVLLFVHWPAGDPQLTKTLETTPVRAIFSGHSHAEGTLQFAGRGGWQSGSLSQTSAGDRKPGYRLVLAGPEGMETFYKATGVPHAITLDRPRSGQAVAAKAEIRGGFYDAGEEIARLNIRVGEVAADVPFLRTPICSRFSADLDLSGEEEGFRRFHLTLRSHDGTEWTETLCFLLLSGRPAEFTAEGNAELVVDACGVDVEAALLVNGAEVGVLPPTELRGDGPFRAPVKDADTVRIPLSRSSLARLNTAEIRPGTGAAGKRDTVCVLDVRLAYGGKDWRDLRRAHGPWHPRTSSDTTTCYIDLLPE
ncbi:MAG: metallophosphoesterase [Lentisphaeria bacterium]|nr:metallophosphoesterase [Lentisphaeria bacterium]